MAAMSDIATSSDATGWFTVRLAARAGSLAAAASALASADIAIDGIVGNPETGDGEVQIGVASKDLDAAVAALDAAGISTLHDARRPHMEPSGGVGEGLELGIIGAILRGPRS